MQLSRAKSSIMDWQFKVFLGVACVFGLLPFAVKNMPHLVTWPSISIGVCLILWGILPNHQKIPIGPAILFIACIAGIAGSVAWYKVVKSDKKLFTTLSIREFFDKDPHFTHLLKAVRNFNVTDVQTKETINITAKLYFDFMAKSKFMSFYIPRSPHTYQSCYNLVDNYETIMQDIELGGEVLGGLANEQTSSRELIFSGRIYIYHEDTLSLQQLTTLGGLYQSKGLSVVFRGPGFLIPQKP